MTLAAILRPGVETRVQWIEDGRVVINAVYRELDPATGWGLVGLSTGQPLRAYDDVLFGDKWERV